MKKSIAMIATGAVFLWPVLTIAQELPPLPPLPEADPATIELEQLRQESADLRQEARDLGGGRTINESIAFVRNEFYANRAEAERLEEMARQFGYTEEELRAEQKRIAESGGFGFGNFATGQARDKAAQEAIKRIISESAGKVFGVASWGSTCYDVTTRIKRWWMTRQQAGSLGENAQKVRENWTALNRLLIALYALNSLVIDRMNRLDEIKKRYNEIMDRMTALRQAPPAPQRATSQAVLTRETDPAYDQLLLKIERLKHERRIAELQSNSDKVRRLNVDIRLLEMQAAREEAVPKRSTGKTQRKAATSTSFAQPLDNTSASLLAYHNDLRAAENSPPLQWNEMLQADAAQWARVMADTGQLRHSPRESRPGDQRENISISRHRASSPMKMAKVWGEERRLYRPGLFPNVCAGDWSSCAHFTQMVWSTTAEVGCAFVQGRRFDALVCRYSPPGNIDGKPVVTPPVQTVASLPCPPGSAAVANRSAE